MLKMIDLLKVSFITPTLKHVKRQSLGYFEKPFLILNLQCSKYYPVLQYSGDKLPI